MHNYYYAITADGQQMGQGVLKARNAEHANEMALETAREKVEIDRFPDITWNIVVSERPFPRGLRVAECEHGREFIFVPLSLILGQ